MARKQKSGHQLRKIAATKRAAREAAGIVLPPIPTEADFASLTAITGTRVKYLVEWLKKKLSTDDFAVLLRALAEFRADAVARIAEREIENDERALALVDAHEARMGALTMIPGNGGSTTVGTVVQAGGELMPSEAKAQQVSE
jgi:hypothetical protein